LGPDGRGAIAHAGLEGEIDVLIGTLGKALGSYGAYVCAQEEMVRYLINTARSLIFSTAPAPPAVAAALAALELLQERPRRVQRLHANARALRRALAAEGFPVAEDDMPIVPLVLGDERQAMRMCQQAIEDGVFAQAIRPPTVPAGTSRLRLAAMASHTAADMVKAAGVLAGAARKLGLDLAQAGAPPHRWKSSEQQAEEADGPDVALPTTEVYAAPAAPFDLERDTGPAPVPAGAAARAPSAPLDGERDGELARRPSAPFDGERDAEIPRAA
jgi:glycine C-acetyltransferase/8-amino-7-oxononanoate synthase